MTPQRPPLSAQELCACVREGRAIDRSRLDRILAVDEGRALVEVQAASTWRALRDRLRPDDAKANALRTTRSTIEASLAWNAAGPDGRSTASHVESFTMVTPDGQLRRISRITHPELFSLVVGGHGAFGALYSVTLRLPSLARAVSDAQTQETIVDGGPAGRKLILLVPPAEAPTLVARCSDLCAEWRVEIRSLALRRLRADQDAFLRWAPRDYAQLRLGLAPASTLGGEVRHTQLRRGLIDLAIAHGGAFPIACTPEATREQTEACYPQLGEFLAEQRRVDPQQRWTNPWLRHQRNLLARKPCEVRWAH